MIKRVQVLFKGLDANPALAADITNKIERLERDAPTLQSCRVVVQAPHRHQARGRRYHVLVDVTLPGQALVVGNEGGLDRAHESPYVAVRDAFRAMRRRVQHAARSITRGQALAARSSR